MNISNASMIRLCASLQLLEDLKLNGVQTVSSGDLGDKLGVGAFNIRKDISNLGEIGNTGSGYPVEKLIDHINNGLGINKKRKSCIVGLGRLGSAIVNNDEFLKYGFEIVAGFDSSNNKLETLRTDIPLFAAHSIVDIVRQKEIEIGILAVPGKAAQDVAHKLMEGGIKGILNCAPIAIKKPNDFSHVAIRNIDLMGEMRILSAMIVQNAA